ncbi:ABC transporter ATP-binding protein [Deferribacter autotrophicus]|uniref:ABC transporter ATP-binding protein n=1 Tax=Deferribacter autotrophicus TaxID=500465 RepID=A0A5A8F6I6_9BACT|nr:ABC transporter ATP-binding protein [Deferribacter autotrophicus]KAA0259430.1 ABC transporter ATP-binding protein [Deferribacter autotrophicus]
MLKIENLNVQLEKTDIHILRDINLQVNKGELFGIAGESGSGKSVLAKTILGLIKYPLIKKSGKIFFKDKELKSDKDFNEIRGKKISMIFQNPTASLNPVLTIGEQLIETIKLHKKCDEKTARKIAINLLRKVEIDFPEERLKSYPFNLSGGMNQRVMIALSLASDPEVLIADEPTTALDVTTQTKIINLLLKLKEEKGLTIIFISHDLSLLEMITDKILIMYAGETMELITKSDLQDGKIKHPYTYALKKSVPDIEHKEEYLYSIPGTIEQNSKSYDNACIFYKRCDRKREICTKQKPQFKNNLKCFNPLISYC